jgi:hypothetical protein
MDALPTTHADVLRADLRTVDEKIKAGVTLQRSKAQDKHWERWDDFCLESGIDPFLRTWDDPVPILQVFGQRYRDGRIAPRHNAVRARTVEDALRAIGQAFARVGSPDVRKNVYGDIDFRIQRQIRAYKREDSPPKRVKPIPIVIILYILAQAYGITRHDDTQAIADMITIAFFFLLRPGEYTGTTSDDTPFRLQDVHLYIGPRRLDTMRCSDAEIQGATSVSYTFTTQKNGIRNEKIILGLSGTGLCCPVRATGRRIRYLRRHNAKCTVPIASLYVRNRRTAIKAQQITATVRHAMTVNFHRTGITANDVSARSLRAGGAMALLCGKVDMNLIQMLGRWHSDAMIRYLHMQAQPIVQHFAAKMYNNGNYSFLPDETVPLLDEDAEL